MIGPTLGADGKKQISISMFDSGLNMLAIRFFPCSGQMGLSSTPILFRCFYRQSCPCHSVLSGILCWSHSHFKLIGGSIFYLIWLSLNTRLLIKLKAAYIWLYPYVCWLLVPIIRERSSTCSPLSELCYRTFKKRHIYKMFV